MSIGPHGDATVTQAVLMACTSLFIAQWQKDLLFVQLLKSFVGTGVLFLGRA
jgi:hypothetical protein